MLPEMIVEKRESTTAHGLPEPDLSKENLGRELQLAIQLNQDVWKSDWERTTLDILVEYIDEKPTHDEIKMAVKDVTGFMSWKECVEFVQDDDCTEFFNMARKYCGREEQAHQNKKGFIDGSGIGYIKAYLRDLKKSLEAAFDAKYYFKVKRPLEWALENEMDLRNVANKIHPGHWSYPAGHGTKFYQAVATLEKVYELDGKCKRVLYIAAGVLSMARSGSLIHYPMDNCVGRKLSV